MPIILVNSKHAGEQTNLALGKQYFHFVYSDPFKNKSYCSDLDFRELNGLFFTKTTIKDAAWSNGTLNTYPDLPGLTRVQSDASVPGLSETRFYMTQQLHSDSRCHADTLLITLRTRVSHVCDRAWTSTSSNQGQKWGNISGRNNLLTYLLSMPCVALWSMITRASSDKD